MVLAVEREQADSILSFIKTYEPNAAIIGSVHDDGHKVTHQNPDVSSSIIEAVVKKKRHLVQSWASRFQDRMLLMVGLVICVKGAPLFI